MSNYFYWRLRRLVAAGKVLIRDGNVFRGILPEDVATSVDLDPETDGDLDIGSDSSHRWRTLRLATSLILSASGTLTAGANTLVGAVADKLNAAHLAIASQATGDLLVASSSTAFTRLAGVGTGQALMSGGVGAAPAYTGSPTFSGDLAAAGGFRQTVGPYAAESIAAGDNATPASATAVALGFAGAPGTSHVAKRAGSVMGVGFHLDTNPAGSSIIGVVTINGVPTAATVALSAGSTRYASATFTKDAVPFAAGDRIALAVQTGSGWSATSAEIVGDIEIEC